MDRLGTSSPTASAPHVRESIQESVFYAAEEGSFLNSCLKRLFQKKLRRLGSRPYRRLKTRPRAIWARLLGLLKDYMIKLKSTKTTFRNCNFCKKEYELEIYRLHKSKYCSRICHNTSILRNYGLERGNKSRGSGAGKSYIKYLGVHLHRMVAELKIGRKLIRGEIVHHIDGNKRNNFPENIQVLSSQKEHIAIHRKQLLQARGL